MDIVDFNNVFQMLEQTVENFPQGPAFRWLGKGETVETVTWKECRHQVATVSKALMALGLEKGDKVNVISYSCCKWVLADLGTMAMGCATVGIYHSNPPKETAYIINHSDARIVFAQDNTQLDKLLEIRHEIPGIERVILFEGDPGEDDWVMGFDDFLGLGATVPDAEFEGRARGVKPSDMAAIVYTSGTTGVPKGAVLTHDNITFTAQSAFLSLDKREGDETFLFLPLAHVFARICVYMALFCGTPTFFARAMTTVIDDIKIARPHWFASVPRIYEKIHGKILANAEAKGGVTLKIFNWALATGREVTDCTVEKRPLSPWLRLKYKVATKLVFEKIHQALGNRVRWCISGAAPINPDILKFFHAAGIKVLEGIGMTENTSFSNVIRLDDIRFGWVGPTGPGIEQKTGGDGEIMYRGRNVMKEYYKMPEKTAKALTKDGWLLTGDLGEIDGSGNLRVTGRKKDLIITSGGKNIAPEPIEGILATCTCINQVMILGDGERFLTAVVTPDPDTVPDWAREKGIPFETMEDLVESGEVKALIQGEIEEKNRDLASFESIKKVIVVPEFTIDNGLMTPTLKLKKARIRERYQREITALYRDAP
ncbi:MAG: long-chain fatty acid--CoA ligase [Desulfobacteraceae bacterium]|nr:long-chain fatty acid--CoA ligase [Desulfobacteraceae bacterium]